ncbi:hypothetical protein D3C86_1046720 [compost metagenome]
MAVEPRFGGGIGADDHKRGGGARRHIHFGARGADAGNEIDQPVDLRSCGIIAELRRRPVGEAKQIIPLLALARRVRPKLFGHEGHEGMQELVDLFQNIGRTGLGFPLRLFVFATEDRLQQFQIPVTELVPDEAIENA